MASIRNIYSPVGDPNEPMEPEGTDWLQVLLGGAAGLGAGGPMQSMIMQLMHQRAQKRRPMDEVPRGRGF